MAIANFVSEIAGDENKPVDIITFAESPIYLGLKLYPIQKFVLKIVYSIPLSDDISHDPIIIKDQFNEKVVRVFNSELEFVQYLYDNDMINSLEFDDELIEIELIIGRRGTKTTISSIITSYTLYLLLFNKSPHEYAGVIKQSEIGVAICSNNKDNASRQLREVSTMVYSCGWFKKFLVTKEPTGSGFFLKTQEEVDDPSIKIGRLYVTVFAASPSVRGSSNIVVIMDEYAHFIDSEASTKDEPLDKKLYEALSPSVSGFQTDDGKALGKAIIITSPNGKKGEVWKDKKSSKNLKSKIFLNIPSWWINPRLTPAFLKSMYSKSEKSFWQEYGAKFVDKESNWIINFDKFYAMRDLRLKNSIRNGNPNIRYYAGVDLALSGDGAAIVVGHHEKKRTRLTEREEYQGLVKNEDIYVVDYISYMLPEKGRILEVDDIIEEMKNIIHHYNIYGWGFDQWSYDMFNQYVAKYGGIKFKNQIKINATQETNSNLARNFKQFMNEGRLILPDDDGFFNEIKDLKEKIAGRFIKVENTSGHDDRFSACLKFLKICLDDPLRDAPINNGLNKRNSKMFKDIHHNAVRTGARQQYMKGRRR